MTIPPASIGLARRGGAGVTAGRGIAATGTGARVIPEHCLVTGTSRAVERVGARHHLPRRAADGRGTSKAGDVRRRRLRRTHGAVTGNTCTARADQPAPIGRGYARLRRANGGHARPARWIAGPDFLLDEESRAQLGWRGAEDTHNAATFVIKAHYAVDKIDKAYFAGGSTGGREALAGVATRSPGRTGPASSPGTRRGSR